MISDLFDAGIVELPNGRRLAVVEFLGHPIAEGPAEALEGEGAVEELKKGFSAALVATLSLVMGSQEFGHYAPQGWAYEHPMAPPLEGFPKGEEG